MPVKAFKAGPAFNWSGFYAGINAGYAWGSRDQVTTDPAGAVVGAATVKPNGFLGGAQIGYNWMVAPAWLLGVETDFAGSSFKDNDDSASGDRLLAPNLVCNGARPGWLRCKQLAAVRHRRRGVEPVQSLAHRQCRSAGGGRNVVAVDDGRGLDLGRWY